MAQGTLKSKKLSTATAKATARRPSVLGPKKGARAIAPRNKVLVKNAKMTKVCLTSYSLINPFFAVLLGRVWDGRWRVLRRLRAKEER